MAWYKHSDSWAGNFLADDEIQALVDQCSQVEQDFEHELVNLKVDAENGLDPKTLRKRDELYEGAIEVVLREGRGSCSLLQRALGIGYGRAARLVDYMAEDGIVGDHNGSSAREVLLTIEEWDAMQNASEGMNDEEREDAELMMEYDSELNDEDCSTQNGTTMNSLKTQNWKMLKTKAMLSGKMLKTRAMLSGKMLKMKAMLSGKMLKMKRRYRFRCNLRWSLRRMMTQKTGQMNSIQSIMSSSGIDHK